MALDKDYKKLSKTYWILIICMGKYALPPCLMKYAIYFHLTMGKLLTFSRINQNMYTDYCAKIIKSNIVIIVCFTIILAITPIKIIDNLLFLGIFLWSMWFTLFTSWIRQSPLSCYCNFKRAELLNFFKKMIFIFCVILDNNFEWHAENK